MSHQDKPFFFYLRVIITISNRIVFIEDGSKLIFASRAQSEPCGFGNGPKRA
jgi:hypothetical protein